MTRLLGQFVRAESPSFDKAAVDRFGKMVAEEWKRRGAKVALLRNENEATTSGRMESGRKKIQRAGPGARAFGYGLRRRDPRADAVSIVPKGRAYGPGTFDMKGGLVIALFAVDALARRAAARKEHRLFVDER
jgi:glutamate carboxypeptidase